MIINGGYTRTCVSAISMQSCSLISTFLQFNNEDIKLEDNDKDLTISARGQSRIVDDEDFP